MAYLSATINDQSYFLIHKSPRLRWLCRLAIRPQW